MTGLFCKIILDSSVFKEEVDFLHEVWVHRKSGGGLILIKTRTQFLETKGYKVIRFWNNDIDNNIESVFLIYQTTTRICNSFQSYNCDLLPKEVNA